MLNNFFLYRYALLYSRFNKASKDKELKHEILFRLNELEVIMDDVLGFEYGADIRNKALDLSNLLTEDDIYRYYRSVKYE